MIVEKFISPSHAVADQTIDREKWKKGGVPVAQHWEIKGWLNDQATYVMSIYQRALGSQAGFIVRRVSLELREVPELVLEKPGSSLNAEGDLGGKNSTLPDLHPQRSGGFWRLPPENKTKGI